MVGAAKAGTTSLHDYLSRHPDIYLSNPKEPKYMSLTANKFPHTGPRDSEVDAAIIKTLEDYAALFRGGKNEKIVGEASADYLYFHETVIPLIKEMSPDAKILILLRNPVDRAFSAYRHMLSDGRETLSFEEALEREKERMRANYEFIWYYKDVGFYERQVRSYLTAFGEASVKVCLQNDLNEDPENVMCDIFKFLGVDENFTPDFSRRLNVSVIPKSESLESFLTDYEHPAKKILRPVLLSAIGRENTERLVNYFKQENKLRIKAGTRKRLIETYREDILKLEKLINRDLSMWLK